MVHTFGARHPDSRKIALTRWDGSLPHDYSKDSVVIWDIVTDEIIQLSGIAFNDTLHTDNVIQWSPDGSKLASISDEGKIIIWETETYHVIAEYVEYRSILLEVTE